MAVVRRDTQGWEATSNDTKGDIQNYLMDVWAWWRDENTGQQYLWGRNASPKVFCVQCRVPMAHEEEVLCLSEYDEGNNINRPLLDTLVCFECVEAQYLAVIHDDRRALLDPFRIGGDN